jgi:hypothetical protein
MKYFGWIEGSASFLVDSVEILKLKILGIMGVLGSSVICKLSKFLAPFF